MFSKHRAPVNGVIPLTGDAADWFVAYMAFTEPDIQAQIKLVRADYESVQRAIAELEKS